MYKILLIIMLFVLSLNAQKILLNEKDLKYIDSLPNKSYIIKRLNAYNDMLKETKNLPTLKKVYRINLFFNKIIPQFDEDKYKTDDYWATPKEFMINGRGDCEDYVISKYFTLIQQGIKKKNLYFAVVKVKNATDYHMVLLYDVNDKLLVLDNLSFKVLELHKRTDLSALYAFNEYSSNRIVDGNLGKKIKINWGKSDNWNKLLKRVYKENE